MDEPNKETMDKKFTSAEIIEKASKEGEFTAIASSGTTDRHGESIDPAGWSLKNFKKNPVLLWAHDHLTPAIGKASKIWLEGEGMKAKLMFKGTFQTVTDEGKAAAALVEQGILKTFSVGFMPTEMDGNTYTKQELLEISLVNVPANPDAMMLAYKTLKEQGFKKKTIENLGIPTAVLDKIDDMSESIIELNDKVELLVKAQSPAEPTMHLKTIRTRQSLTKVIAKASDHLLSGEKKGVSQSERITYLKIIKRGAEILSQSNKGELNG